MIQSIIVDDEQKNRETLQLMIEEYCTGIEVTFLAADIQSAKEIIEANKPHLVFLDVEMPPYNAFDLLKSLDNIEFEIIFVTAFNYYAIEAIKFSALYYILKPVKVEELVEAVEKAKIKIASKSQNYAEKLDVLFQNPENLEKIIVSSQNESIIVELDDISHIEAANSYSTIYKSNKQSIISSKPILEYDKLLSSRNFFRIHKSFLINLSQIAKVEKGDNLVVIMKNNTRIPIAVRRKDDFFNLIKN